MAMQVNTEYVKIVQCILNQNVTSKVIRNFLLVMMFSGRAGPTS